MSRKPTVGKSVRPSSASIAFRPEEVPLLPEMPSFFPNPVALDAEDRHLVAYRDALFQREYEQSSKALLYHVQMQLEKEEEDRGVSCLPSPRFSGVDTQAREASCAVLSLILPEHAPETAPEPLTPFETKGSLLNGGRPSVFNTKGRRKSVTNEDTMENSQVVSFKRASIASIIPVSDKDEIGEGVTGKEAKTVSGLNSNENDVGAEGDQLRQQSRYSTPLKAPELPVYLTQPTPSSLITLAAEVGIANASRGTCAAVMTILKAEQQQGGSISPLLCSVQLTEATPETEKTPETTSPIAQAVLSPANRRVGQSIPLSPMRYVSTFPLIDALVLEAEQRVAMEINCKSICDEIVSLAAENHVTRCFDALGTGYTAYSVWDELHDNVIRSFIPHDPGKPRSLELELNSALAIREAKNKKLGTENVVRERSTLLQGSWSVNKSAPYLGMLPIWALSPSLLSADAILSFHQKTALAPKVFSGRVVGNGDNVSRSDDEKGRSKRTLHRLQSSTFSRLLAASVEGGEKRHAINGVIVTDFSSTGKSREAWRVRGFTNEEDENSPGDPPSAVPLDDYARYVIPRSDDILNKKKEEAVEKKNQEEEELTPRKVQRRFTGRKSQTAPGTLGNTNQKVSEVEVRRPLSRSSAPAPSSYISTDYSPSQVSTDKRRRGKKLQEEVSDGDSHSIGGSTPARTASPELVGEDNWTKALRHFPHGYLSMAGNTSHATTSRNQTLDALVLIEGENAVTVASNAKKEKAKLENVVSTMGLKSPKTRGRSLSPTTRGGVRSHETSPILQVIITNAGTVSFNTVQESLTTNEATQNRVDATSSHHEDQHHDYQKQQQPQAELQKEETQSRRANSRFDGHSFLSRKEQRKLEERMRRQKEAAEKAAYESMFFTASQPVGDASADTTENAGGSPDALKPQQAVKIAPEPGVLVELWPTTSPRRNTKAGVVIDSKSRYRRGKDAESASNQIQSEAVVSDGGEWTLPEGKYRWSGFDPAHRERMAATAATRSTLTHPKEERSIGPQRNSGERGDIREEGSITQNKEFSSVNNPFAKVPPRPVARPIPRAAIIVASARKDNDKFKQKRERHEGAKVKAVDEKAKTANVKESHVTTNMPVRIALPRLPSRPQHSRSDDETPLGRRNVQTHSTVENNKIRLLASILQNTTGATV